MSIKRVFHWGPLLALGIIKVIAFTTLFITSMWLPPMSSLFAALNHLIFLGLVGASLYNFFLALAIGPGFVPLNWQPANTDDKQNLQFCTSCNGFKPPRSHHCRKCRRCVMKMDHHCPWINTCCGHFNHANFTTFLIASVLGAFQATILLTIGLYKSFNISWYLYHGYHNQIVYMTLWGFIFCVFSIGLAIGVVLAVGGLFIIQMKIILKNETSIENWIVSKALTRERAAEKETFIFPYNLGWKENLLNVFWYKIGDGIHWNVLSGSHPFALTIEQLEQKKEKRDRTLLYTVIQNYNGSWCPLGRGIKVCFNSPCSDEPRIQLKVEDQVYVTRWRKHWLYGEVQHTNKALSVRGWFPRACAIEFTSPECDVERMNKKHT